MIVALFTDRADRTDLVDAHTAPSDAHPKLFGRGIDEIAYAILNTCGDNEIFRLILLKHQPLHLDIIPSMTPVA